jgi:hypothetical protein
MLVRRLLYGVRDPTNLREPQMKRIETSVRTDFICCASLVMFGLLAIVGSYMLQ